MATLAATTDVRQVIGFSSFAVLVYYLIANAAAWTLTETEGRPVRIIPIAGAAGCVVLAFSLPASSVLAGTVVLAFGALAYAAHNILARRLGH